VFIEDNLNAADAHDDLVRDKILFEDESDQLIYLSRQCQRKQACLLLFYFLSKCDATLCPFSCFFQSLKSPRTKYGHLAARIEVTIVTNQGQREVNRAHNTDFQERQSYQAITTKSAWERVRRQLDPVDVVGHLIQAEVLTVLEAADVALTHGRNRCSRPQACEWLLRILENKCSTIRPFTVFRSVLEFFYGSSFLVSIVRHEGYHMGCMGGRYYPHVTEIETVATSVVRTVEQCHTPHILPHHVFTNRDYQDLFNELYMQLSLGNLEYVLNKRRSISVHQQVESSSELQFVFSFMESQANFSGGNSQQAVALLDNSLSNPNLPANIQSVLLGVKLWIQYCDPSVVDRGETTESMLLRAMHNINLYGLKGRSAGSVYYCLVRQFDTKSVQLDEYGASKEEIVQCRKDVIGALKMTLDYHTQSRNSLMQDGLMDVSVEIEYRGRLLGLSSALLGFPGKYYRPFSYEISNADIKEARSCLKEATGGQLPPSDILRCNIYRAWADYYLRRRKYPVAIINSRIALNLARKLKISRQVARSMDQIKYIGNIMLLDGSICRKLRKYKLKKLHSASKKHTLCKTELSMKKRHLASKKQVLSKADLSKSIHGQGKKHLHKLYQRFLARKHRLKQHTTCLSDISTRLQSSLTL
jgi:hypothetical protein